MGKSFLSPRSEDARPRSRLALGQIPDTARQQKPVRDLCITKQLSIGGYWCFFFVKLSFVKETEIEWDTFFRLAVVRNKKISLFSPYWIWNARDFHAMHDEIKRKSSPSTWFLSSFFSPFIFSSLSPTYVKPQVVMKSLVDNKMGDILFFHLARFVHSSGWKSATFFRPVHQKCHCPSCVRRIITKFGWLYYTPDHLQPFHPLSIPNWNSVGIVPLSRSSNHPLPRWPSGDSPSWQIKIVALASSKAWWMNGVEMS